MHILAKIARNTKKLSEKEEEIYYDFPMTGFQIKGGSLVQGVTKLMTTFFSMGDPPKQSW